MTMSTSDAPDLTDKSVKKVYIKDGMRKMMSDTGTMHINASHSKSVFGRLKGGRYSILQ